MLVSTLLLSSLLAFAPSPAVAASASSLGSREQPFPFNRAGGLMPVARRSPVSSFEGKRHENGTVDSHHAHRRPAKSSLHAHGKAPQKKKASSARKHASRTNRAEKRQDASTLLEQATSMLSGMQTCQNNFHQLVAILGTSDGPSMGSKHSYQQNVHKQLAAYRRASSDFPVLSAAFQKLKASIDSTGADADNGKANLDECNKLEVVLTDANRSIQDMLADIDLAVYSLPILGNELGTLVYDLKCLVDAALDTTTNTVDGLLNGSSLLSRLSSQLGDLACKLTPGLDGCSP